jgi:RimJ/RimL family protein N-acetyltransferase
MKSNDLRGELVRLTAEDPETWAAAISRWGRDSEYIRLLDNDPPHLWSVKKIKEWFEKDLEKETPENYEFGVRSLADNRLIGFVGLGRPFWSSGDAWVGIGMGERAYWGLGFGTEAMRLVLGFGFNVLNLHRVSLGVFAYNARAIRSYEKCGFRLEGCLRQCLNRDGRRWDIFIMGLLRSEWERLSPGWWSASQPVETGNRIDTGVEV